MKICISRIDKMGDLILSLPAIKSLKDNNNIEIDLVSSEQNYKILHNLQYIDNKIEINTRLGTKNLKIIRKKKYDLYINLSPTYLSYFLCFFSRSNKKATLIFTSRYSNSFFSKFFIRVLSNIFCDHVNLVKRYNRLKNNEEIIAKVDNVGDRKIGDKINLFWDSSKIHYFNKENKRI